MGTVGRVKFTSDMSKMGVRWWNIVFFQRVNIIYNMLFIKHCFPNLKSPLWLCTSNNVMMQNTKIIQTYQCGIKIMLSWRPLRYHSWRKEWIWLKVNKIWQYFNFNLFTLPTIEKRKRKKNRICYTIKWNRLHSDHKT